MNITNQIKKISITNLIYPAIIVFVVAVFFITLPFGSVFSPTKLDSIWDSQKKDYEYNFVYTSIDNLYYTGYDVSRFLGSDYGYYYILKDEKCIFVLIPTGSKPKEHIKNYNIYGRVTPASDSSSFNKMLPNLAEDLNWSESGLRNISGQYIINNTDYHPLLFIFVFLILLIGVALAVYLVVMNIRHYNDTSTYHICPHTNPSDRKRLIEKAENELNNNLIINLGDLYLTEHFFIEFNRKKVIILPLMRIVWGYRMGTLNYKIRHKVPTYNLFFTLTSGDIAVITNKSSEETRLMLEAIRELNYGVILGYTDSKRKKAKELIKKS